MARQVDGLNMFKRRSGLPAALYKVLQLYSHQVGSKVTGGVSIELYGIRTRCDHEAQDSVVIQWGLLRFYGDSQGFVQSFG